MLNAVTILLTVDEILERLGAEVAQRVRQLAGWPEGEAREPLEEPRPEHLAHLTQTERLELAGGFLRRAMAEVPGELEGLGPWLDRAEARRAKGAAPRRTGRLRRRLRVARAAEKERARSLVARCAALRERDERTFAAAIDYATTSVELRRVLARERLAKAALAFLRMAEGDVGAPLGTVLLASTMASTHALVARTLDAEGVPQAALATGLLAAAARSAHASAFGPQILGGICDAIDQVEAASQALAYEERTRETLQVIAALAERSQGAALASA